MIEGPALGHWLAARAGKVTGSRMNDVMTITRKGEPGAARANYMRELLAERLTGLSVRHFVTAAMQWGLDHEQEAIRHYEMETGNIVRPTHFYEHPRIPDFGATPDGEVGVDGLLEVKCPTTPVYLEWRLAGGVPEIHRPQMIAECVCSGRKWVDFVAFDPRIQKENLRLFVRRFVPSAEEIASVEAAVTAFLADLEKCWNVLIEAA
jgi:hypothetical protein